MPSHPHPILDHQLISDRYFFPRPDHFDDPFYVDTGEARLGCWRSAPPSTRPVLLHFHGNGEVVGDWIEFFGPFCQSLGYEAFLAEYRGYGMSSGEPKLAQMLGDLDALAEAIGVPPSQVVVFGRSVGSIYAIEWISRFADTAGLVIESGIHDVHQRLRLRVDPRELGCSEEEFIQATRTYLDHGEKLSAYQKPSLLIHAQGDQLVTVDHAYANAAAAQNSSLKVLPRGGHNNILAANSSEYLESLATFLSSVASTT